MKKGIAKFTAFCLASGFTFGAGGQVMMAAGADTVFVGVGSTAKKTEATYALTGEEKAEETETAQETEAAETSEETTAQAEESAQTEAQTETEPETQAPVDKSMIGTTGFAQTDEYLNVRASGDTQSDVVGKIYNNGSVEILDVDDNGWYYIKSGNVEGYVAGQYVATGQAAQEIAEDTGYTTAEVGAEVLNVRREPDESSDVVDTVLQSSNLEVVEDDGDWVKVVTDDGIYGYVSCDYVNTTTEYATGETLEEEQDRLDQQWLEYLAQQEAAAQAAAAQQTYAEPDYSEPVYTDAQAAADQAAADAQAQAEAAAAAQAAADQAAAQAAAAAEAAAAQAQTYTGDDVESTYAAYVDAQNAADQAVANGADEDTINSTAAAAQEAYGVYVKAQNAADQAAQAQADAAAAAQAQAEADAAAQAQADAQAAADQAAAQAQAAADEAAAQAAAAQAEADAQAQAAADAQAQAEAAAQAQAEADAAAQAQSYSSAGQQIADFATQFVGNPYVWGGESLTNGADCSGFTKAVYANFGVSLPHSAAAQSGYGTAVSYDQMQPGDLLFYDNGGGIGHVSMYIGNGQVVHASSSTTGIKISSADYRTPVAIRRMV